jgi:prolyl oligopeptidase PreP (S9A serine peptidase family)
MIPDKLDIFIMQEIFIAYQVKKDSNSWEMAKKYSSLVKEKDVDKVYKKIKARIKNYCNIGIFFESSNGNKKLIYNMDLNKVTLVKHKFNDGFHLCILFRI